MLSPEEQTEALRVLRGWPLSAHWPDFETVYLSRLQLSEYPAGSVVYQPGDPPAHMFILLEGTVIQTAEHEGRAWFSQVIRPGQFFGQHALFRNEYRSTARVVGGEDARILRMSAADLRVGLERDTNLYEMLLHEKLASRLRRIPLLRELEDDEVRWLALVVQEASVQATERVPVDSQAGVWIVDSGQVAVTGPANTHPDIWEQWRLTSGHFFTAVGGAEGGAATSTVLEPLDTMQHGIPCSADTAVAHVPTRLIFIPADHAERLASIPEVAAQLERPLDIVPILQDLSLFDGLSERQISHLAQFVAWEFVPAGQNVTTQGNLGHSFVILRQGAAAVVAYDDQGRERPRNKLLPVSAYGETSLLEGKARDATVRAVQSPQIRGADVLVLDRRDLQYAFSELPDLWSRDEPLVSRSVQEKVVHAPLPWMQEGEVLLWKGRPHWLWLAIPLAGVAVLGIFLLAVAAFAELEFGASFVPGVLIALAVLLVPVVLVIVVNYHDDYYAVTNRRVTRRDRQLFLYESRQEAPIEMIQDVTVINGFWGRIFNYGNVTLRTASKVGGITFRNASHPDVVQEVVEVGRTEALAAARGRQKEDLRRGLITGLQLALPIPQRDRPLGDAPPPGNAVTSRMAGLFSPRQRERGRIRIPQRPSVRPLLERLTRSWPEETRNVLLGPSRKVRPISGELVWRKHWLNLVGRAGIPLLLTVLFLALLLFAATTDFVVLGLNPGAIVLPLIALLVIATGWLLWQIEDWRNDLYIVTDDRIVDIEMEPLGLNEKRREGGLDRVQNVSLEQKGLLALIFKYGDVIISTAAANEGFTFNMVPNPKDVQAMIFQKLDAYRARQEEKRLRERQREIIEGLEVYHRLRGSREVPPEWRDY